MGEGAVPRVEVVTVSYDGKQQATTTYSLDAVQDINELAAIGSHHKGKSYQLSAVEWEARLLGALKEAA